MKPDRPFVDRTLLAMLILVVSLANLYWIRADAAPMPHPADPYIYATNTLVFMDGLTESDFRESLSDLSHRGRPPLYQMLSIPFVVLFGRSIDAMLGLNVTLTGILLVLVFAFGRSLSSSRAGLLAAVAVATAPPAIHLSRIFRPHGAVPMFTVLSIWLLLRLVRDRSAKSAWLFCASLVLGILFHPTFGFVLVIPTLVFGVYAVFFSEVSLSPEGGAPTSPSGLAKKFGARLSAPFFVRGIVPAAAFAVLVSLSWYATMGTTLVEKARDLGTAEKILQIGFTDIKPDFWWYALTSPGTVTLVVALLSLAGVLACLAKRRLGPVLLAVTALAGYSVESLTWTRCWWYFVAVLPFWSLAMGVWICEIRRQWLSRLLAGTVLGSCTLTFFVSTWGAPAGLRPIVAALGAPIDSTTCTSTTRSPGAFCPTPPEEEAWPTPQILESIVKDAPDCASGRNSVTHCQVFLVIPSFVSPDSTAWPLIKRSYFDYHAVRDWPDTKFDFVSYKAGPFCGFSVADDSDYIVHFRSSPRVEKYCMGRWARRLEKEKLKFARSHQNLATIALPGDQRADVLKKRRPVIESQ